MHTPAAEHRSDRPDAATTGHRRKRRRRAALATRLAWAAGCLCSTATAAGPGAADYPWTNEPRPTIQCRQHTSMQACKAAGGVIIEEETELEPFDPERRLHFGEHYDPAAWHECRKGRLEQDITCERYRLHRIELPVHFPYPEVPLPDLPPAVQDGGYREGMTSLEYFEHLCENDAGKFIYERVEGVEGIFQMRPRVFASDIELKDRYVMQAPWGYTQGETDNTRAAHFLGPSRYSYFETTLFEPGRHTGIEQHLHPSVATTPPTQARYMRFSGNLDRSASDDIIKSFDDELKSQFGYFWRDIRRTKDRELGIGGGEIIIVELSSNRVLALLRGFVRSSSSRRPWWLAGTTCPLYRGDPWEISDFIGEVVVPRGADQLDD